MKLSIFTTVTNPEQRGDNWLDALRCYDELADEVVIVDGSTSMLSQELVNFRQIKIIFHKWPKEFSWPFIGKQFQRGYEATTGDWAIHADLDFIFHENDFARIRQALKDYPNAPAVSFYKYQFIQPTKYNLKSRLVVAVNKAKYGNRIRFDSGGDLCQPSLDGKEIKAEDVPQAGIPFYNYEKLTKTEAQIKDDVGRMARAWYSHFSEYKLGGPDNESAYAEWLKMVQGRYSKPQTQFSFSEHPKFVKETIARLMPDLWGHSGFGYLQ